MTKLDTHARLRLAFTAPVRLLASDERGQDQRTVDVVCSTELTNDHGFRVKQDGWDLSRFAANPVVLYGHNTAEAILGGHDPRNTLPIGRAENMRVEDGALRCTIRFASAEANPLAENVYRLMQEGVLSAVSVGFVPLVAETEGENDDETTVVTRAQLYELSVVPIGSDPGAVRESNAKTLIQLAAPRRGTSETAMPDVKKTVKLAAEETPASPADSASPPAAEPDGDEPKAPAFAVGDAVMFDGRPAEIAAIVDEPCYSINFTDEDGGAVSSVCESDLEAASAESDADETMADGDDEEKKELRAQVRALKLQLASKRVVEQKQKTVDVVKLARNERKITPASAGHLTALVGAIGANRKAHAALASFLAAQPRIAALTSDKSQPSAKAAGSPVDLSFNGKGYSELTFAEKHELLSTNKELYDAMKLAHEKATTA